jgi:hypothetical protein
MMEKVQKPSNSDLWCCCAPLLHELHYQHFFPVLFQKTVAISFLEGRQGLFKFFRFGECVCASTALTALWFQHSQMKARFCHLLLIQCDWEIHHHLRGIALERSVLRLFSEFYAHHEHFRNQSCAKLTIAYPKCDNLVEKGGWNCT